MEMGGSRLLVLTVALLFFASGTPVEFKSAESPDTHGEPKGRLLIQKAGPGSGAPPLATTKATSTHKVTTKKTTTEPIPEFTPPGPVEILPNHGEIEKFLDDVYLFEDSVNRNAKLVIGHEFYTGKGENYDHFVFNSVLGSIVLAGPKTRAYTLGDKLCVGLHKLYQWYNQTNQITQLTLDYLDVTNEGDRQPLGLCAPREGMCGADVPLYVYSGTHDLDGNPKKLSYFYATSANHKFTPDKAHYKLASDEPLCWIYSRSQARAADDKIEDVHSNLHLRNVVPFIQPVYEYHNKEHMDTFYTTELLEDKFAKDFRRVAFNTFKNSSELAKVCDLIELVTFVYIPDRNYTNRKKTKRLKDDIIFTSPEKIAAARKNTTAYRNPDSLGFGVRLNHKCRARLLYKQYYAKEEHDHYIARDEHPRSTADAWDDEVAFYSF